MVYTLTTFYTLLDRIRPSPHVEILLENLPQTSFSCTDNSFHPVRVIYSVYVAHQSGGRQQSSVWIKEWILLPELDLGGIQNVFFLWDVWLERFVISYLSGPELCCLS